MTKRIYLDVDGVIAPYDPIQRVQGWHYRNTKAAGLQITYSPNLVTELLQLDAEIIWLTSWEENAAQELAPTLGLPHYRVLHPPATHDGSEKGPDWWKLQAIQQDDPTDFYWIDDELLTNMSATHWAEHNGGHWISPNPLHGLTPHHIGHLKTWATALLCPSPTPLSDS